MSISTSDRVGFGANKITRDKEGHSVMIKESTNKH